MSNGHGTSNSAYDVASGSSPECESEASKGEKTWKGKPYPEVQKVEIEVEVADGSCNCV